jgi:Flp pilus assembly protein TadD
MTLRSKPVFAARNKMLDALDEEATRLLMLGEHTARVRLIEKAVEANPGRDDLCHKLVCALRAAGEMERAIAFCREMVAARPDDEELRGWLITTLHRAGRREAALHELAEIERLGMWVYQREISLGSSLVRLGEVSEGLTRMRAEIDRCIVAGSPYTAEYLQRFAEHLEDLGRTDGALSALQEGVAVEPDNGWAHRALAECLSRTKHMEAAVIEARLAAKMLPENTSTLLLLSCCAEEAGVLEEARAACERALSVVMSDTSFLEVDREWVRGQAHTQLAAVLLRQGEAEQALAQIELALPHYEHWEAYLLRGRILAALGRHQEARSVLAEVEREGGDVYAPEARALLEALTG